MVDSNEEDITKDVQNTLKTICPNASCSPSRRQESLKQGVEFYATLDTSLDEFEQLIPQLNSYWNADMDYFEDYGFNTKMFHPHVYYLKIEE